VYTALDEIGVGPIVQALFGVRHGENLSVLYVASTANMYDLLCFLLAYCCNAAFGYCHNMSSLPVKGGYCDKTAAVRIMQFSLKCSPMP